MKMYRKKLDSLEALKREKIRLRYERLKTDASDLNPIAEIGRSKVSGNAKTGLLATVMELATSTSQLQTALAIGKPLLGLLSRRRSREVRYVAERPKKKSAVKKVLTDILVCYIIGKALQVSVHGIQMYRRRKKARMQEYN